VIASAWINPSGAISRMCTQCFRVQALALAGQSLALSDALLAWMGCLVITVDFFLIIVRTPKKRVVVNGKTLSAAIPRGTSITPRTNYTPLWVSLRSGRVARFRSRSRVVGFISQKSHLSHDLEN
jgi:hypothetical protein